MSVNFSWPIYGQQAQQKFLQSAIVNQRLASTYLFYGPKGLGKKLTLDYFVKSILCLDEVQKPCGKCEFCKLLEKKSYLDLYTIGDQQDDLSIDDIRDFIKRISLAKVHNQVKIAIIYQGENLNIYSSNALLKTLEEPPLNTIMILVADQINHLPATVLSRCQLVKFQALSNQDMLKWLQKFDLPEQEKETVINLSFGRPGLALSLMSDNLETFKKNCNFIIKLLGGNTFNVMQTIDKWFELLKKENPEAKSSDLGEMSRGYLDLLEVCCRDLLWLKLDRPVVNQIYREALEKIADQFSVSSLLNNLKSLNYWKQQLKYNVNPQLLWENLFLNIK